MKGEQTMKKIISLILAVFMIAAVSINLSSCDEIDECDFCGSVHKVKDMHMNMVYDTPMYMCQDCYEEFEPLFK